MMGCYLMLKLSQSCSCESAADFRINCCLGKHLKCWQAYNPEEDEGEDVKVVHPKTDEQRTRLQERVQSQLLFRTLDQDQLIEVDITAPN